MRLTRTRNAAAWLCAVIVVLPLGACDRGGAPTLPTPITDAAAEPLRATILYHREMEPGIEPYTVRTLVTERYLRIDNGADEGDFVLLDRPAREISSTTGGDRTILVIRYFPGATPAPLPLDNAVETLPLEGAPEIEGRAAGHYHLLVNGSPCYDVVAVPNLLADALAALREYREILASEQRRVLPLLPDDTHEACDLSRNVFFPLRQLAYGMPLQEWDTAGYRRELVNYQRGVAVDPGLFTLPEGYTRYTMEERVGDGDGGGAD